MTEPNSQPDTNQQQPQPVSPVTQQYSQGYTQNPYQQASQSPYYQPAAPQPYYQQPADPASETTDGFAIAGFILSFFTNIIGLVLGIIAINRIKTTHTAGRGLAVAAIAISAVKLIILVICVIIAVGFGLAVGDASTTNSDFALLTGLTQLSTLI